MDGSGTYLAFVCAVAACGRHQFRQPFGHTNRTVCPHLIARCRREARNDFFVPGTADSVVAILVICLLRTGICASTAGEKKTGGGGSNVGAPLAVNAKSCSPKIQKCLLLLRSRWSLVLATPLSRRYARFQSQNAPFPTVSERSHHGTPDIGAQR